MCRIDVEREEEGLGVWCGGGGREGGRGRK